MAQDFERDLQRNVGTSAVTLRTANSDDACIGIRVANVTASTVKAYNEDGVLSLEKNGEIAAIEISYTGTFKGNNMMPEGWNVMAGDRRIVIWSMGKRPIPTNLFTYVGVLNIKTFKYVTWDLQLNHAPIIRREFNSWRSQSLWSTETRKYEEIKPTVYDKKIRKTSI